MLRDGSASDLDNRSMPITTKTETQQIKLLLRALDRLLKLDYLQDQFDSWSVANSRESVSSVRRAGLSKSS